MVAVTTLGLLMGGIEVALFFAVRLALRREIDWPQTLMAVLAAVLLGLGVLEQYLAIWKNRSVEGISFLFCGIDALGDVTSIVSVAFEPTVNALGFTMYGVEFILWCGVFACGFWLKWVPWLKTRLVGFGEATRPDIQTSASMEPHFTLQNLPSSTSVFRMASGDTDLRQRQVQDPVSYQASAPTV